MRYFLDLTYDCTAFHGWQMQPGERTVLVVVQAALTKLLRQPISVTGSGRTDARRVSCFHYIASVVEV